MRLIDADELLTAFPVDDEPTLTKSCVRMTIKNMPTIEPEQRWIPCSKKYPDMDERVLVYTVGHEYHVWDCMSNRGDSYCWEDEDGLYHNKYEVDKWMPLPEPYKEDSDG